MFMLLPYRVLVLPDDGSDSVGTIQQHRLRGYSCLTDNPVVEDPEAPPGESISHNHIVFIKEGAVEVEVDGVVYLAMHISNIVGYIPD